MKIAEQTQDILPSEHCYLTPESLCLIPKQTQGLLGSWSKTELERICIFRRGAFHSNCHGVAKLSKSKWICTCCVIFHPKKTNESSPKGTLVCTLQNLSHHTVLNNKKTLKIQLSHLFLLKWKLTFLLSREKNVKIHFCTWTACRAIGRGGWVVHTAKIFCFTITPMITYLISRRHFKAVDFFFPAPLDTLSWRQNRAVFLLLSGTNRGDIKCPFHCTSFLSPAVKSTVANALKTHLCKHHQHQRALVAFCSFFFWFYHFYKIFFTYYVSKKNPAGKLKTLE